MGKPLKSKSLQKSGLKAQVLKLQGVKKNQRTRLGHSGHFGKVEIVPIERKEKKEKAPVNSAEKKKKSKFNKFRKSEDDFPAGTKELPEDTPASRPVVTPEAEKGEKARNGGQERLPGESFPKFMKRVNRETRQELVKQASKAKNVNEKRKTYLDQRKKEKKEIKASKKAEGLLKQGKGKDKRIAVDGHEEEESLKALEKNLQAIPDFGEQAYRPPIIKLDKPLKGLQKAVAPSGGGGYIVGGMPSIPELSGSEKKKREMEALRKNAISQYRSIVQAKRENKGLVSIGALKEAQ